MLRSRRRCVFVAAVLIFCAAAQTFAAFTPIQNPPFDEDSHAKILGHTYGGTFVASGLNFTNGTILAERIEDRISSGRGGEGDPMNMGVPGGDGTDQFWSANFVLASAEARFALYPQEFGFFPGTSGGTYNQLFSVSGTGYNVIGEADLGRIGGQIIRFARAGQGRTFSSREFDNADQYDHMVTYQINNRPGVPSDRLTWLILWEDLFLNEPSDLDYNDLVVEIEAIVIPEPATAATLALLALMGAARRNRNSI